MLGTPLGPGVSGEPRQAAIDFCARWLPILQALQDGRLDLAALPQAEREMLDALHIPAMTGWVRAMLDWPVVAPPDFCCPTLYLVGSEDRHAMQSLKEYEGSIPALCFRCRWLKAWITINYSKPSSGYSRFSLTSCRAAKIILKEI